MPQGNALCPYTSLRRGVMDKLCVPSPRNAYKPKVRSVSLREEGQKSATRLVHLPELLAYLEAQAAEQAQEPAEATL
jgi:hypothetical protein